MTKKDVPQVFKIFSQQQENYKFKYKFSQEDIMYYLLPREGLLYTWVIENLNEAGKLEVTDFYSMHLQRQQCCKLEKVNGMF